MSEFHRFVDTDARADQLSQAIEQWLSDLADAIDEAHASGQFPQ